MTSPFRIEPALPAQAYQTYAVLAPLSTHWRVASCAEVDCSAHANGWSTTVDEATELGQRQAYYIRYRAGRSFTEHRGETGLTVFDFPAGQSCFATDGHRISLERDEIFIRRGGDWRWAEPGSTYRHTRPELWVEDFADHQDRIATAIERG